MTSARSPARPPARPPAPDATVLVLNVGSSTVKYRVVDADDGHVHGRGLVEGVGEPTGRLVHHCGVSTCTIQAHVPDHATAVEAALDAIDEHGPDLGALSLRAVGHRVVHGGSRFTGPTLVTDEVVEAIRDLAPLAPLHNRADVEGLEQARRRFPSLPHVAVFDTAFHQTLPPAAHTYAVPPAWREAGVRRHGFHGTSVAYVCRAAADLLGREREDLRLIVLHLGNGASATAVAHGHSVETSMGLTPLEGLVMGSRSGDLDPAVPGYVRRVLGWGTDAVEAALNEASGLQALAGSNDLRTIEAAARAGDEHAQLALEVYCHRVRKYVGAYYAVLGAVDAVILTGGVGEHAVGVRARALSGLQRLGIDVDPEANRAAVGRLAAISRPGGEVAVLVVPTDEEWEIARESLTLLRATS